MDRGCTVMNSSHGVEHSCCKLFVLTAFGGAENAGVENAGVKNAGADRTGKNAGGENAEVIMRRNPSVKLP